MATTLPAFRKQLAAATAAAGYPAKADLDAMNQPLVVAVEPMTAPAEAFNSGRGLRRLAPGETWELHWGIRLD